MDKIKEEPKQILGVLAFCRSMYFGEIFNPSDQRKLKIIYKSINYHDEN